MLGQHGRGFTKAIFTAPARGLARLGVSPDAVTWTGTLVTCALAIGLIPTGHAVLAPPLLGIVTLFDSLDGILARLTGKASAWGAFLDSTLDRVSDGAIFASIALYALWHMEGAVGTWALVAALACTVLGAVVPYARARAEAIGASAAVGMTERTDRLIISLVALFLVGVGAPSWVLAGALSVLAVLAAITVGQRMATVYRQVGPAASATGQAPATAEAGAPAGAAGGASDTATTAGTQPQDGAPVSGRADNGGQAK